MDAEVNFMGWRSRTLTQPEAEIEKYLVRKIKDINGLCWKFTSPGTKGVPDRIVVVNGMTIFVELKRPLGGRIDPTQAYRVQQIRERGGTAYFINNKNQIKQLVKHLKDGQLPDEL